MAELDKFVARGIAAQRAVDALIPPKRELWRVELEVPGYAWVHTWEGHALNSLEATHLAACDLWGKPMPETGDLRVRSCLQVNV